MGNKNAQLKHIKDFPPIIGDIMIVGTTATNSSRNRGMYYTSGNNDIWKIIDACIQESNMDNPKPSFNDYIENEYRKVPLSNNDIEVIKKYLDKGVFLTQTKEPLSHNLELLKQKQKKLFSMLEQYNIGFVDTIAECDMSGSSDTDIKNERKKNKEYLLGLIKDKKVVILNGIGAAVKKFKKACQLNGEPESVYLEFKQTYSIKECYGSSGANRKYDAERLTQWKNAIVPIINETNLYRH